ncbi:lipase [Nitzschia inconspicua]|uniref:Lipase n=1 Tax=Nitzschia inconspicua TaxID=303405 RepID=A0A9K3PDZ0_9STRA|nr:lipase [Nitzschia inconspicua]
MPSATATRTVPPTATTKIRRSKVKLHRLPENNLYREARDMSLVSFLIYVWSKIVYVLKDEIPSEKRNGGWSPKDVKQFIEKHKSKLVKEYPSGEFTEGSITYQALDVLMKRSPNRELALLTWDSDFQTKELVFGVCRDDMNQRITVVFRGTESSMAFKSNWDANLDIGKSSEKLPEILKGKLPNGGKKVWIHSGFHEYMNKATEDPTDHVERTKKDQVLSAVKDALRENPKYRVYVTGHSLGAALATLTSYYLATDVDDFAKTGRRSMIPKPITCINFASPRIGDSNFLDAVQVLERSGMLRICRFVNEKDLVCVLPTFNYKHVGFMVKMHRNDKKKITVCYPKFHESWGRWWNRALAMSWPAALNLTYDHSSGEYGRRVEIHKKELEKKFLSKMYSDETRTGFFKKGSL